MTRTSTWLRLMFIAFLANGLGPFGLKILAERGLAERYHYQYLLAWYAGGLIFGLASLGSDLTQIRWKELAVAFAIGAGSFGGQFFSLLALERNVPGYIVFPVTTGGNLFLVAAAGVLLFREKIGAYGIAGIVTGIVSLVLLAMP
jgi:multidrug transporter EmrE-like cation transporter